jgi:hypothetical protein
MSVIYGKYNVEEETYLKALILSRGVVFSEKALKVSVLEKAKRQNLVYNMPLNATNSRPQELIIKNVGDSYSVVVSCVASNPTSSPVVLDADEEGKLFALVDDEKVENVEIHFVEEPEYYAMKLSNGEQVKKYVSACGLDELNIIPWKGCAISRGCRFCGINNFVKPNELSAHRISRDNNEWKKVSEEYLDNLEEAILIAKKSECYKEHAHVILIAGNLDNNNLDFETEVFSSIAKRVAPLVNDISEEGVVAVITPPNNIKYIDELKKAGVEKVVFNLEAITECGFEKYCPEKADLGYQFFIDRLKYAIDVLGKGNVWTNLVFGLENVEETLEKCAELIVDGVVISANVLHLDKGNSLDCDVPSTKDVIDFFYRLDLLNKQEGFVPFYCAKALRTSLSNEAHAMRIKEREN